MPRCLAAQPYWKQQMQAGLLQRLALACLCLVLSTIGAQGSRDEAEAAARSGAKNIQEDHRDGISVQRRATPFEGVKEMIQARLGQAAKDIEQGADEAERLTDGVERELKVYHGDVNKVASAIQVVSKAAKNLHKSYWEELSSNEPKRLAPLHLDWKTISAQNVSDLKDSEDFSMKMATVGQGHHSDEARHSDEAYTFRDEEQPNRLAQVDEQDTSARGAREHPSAESQDNEDELRQSTEGDSQETFAQDSGHGSPAESERPASSNFIADNATQEQSVNSTVGDLAETSEEPDDPSNRLNRDISIQLPSTSSSETRTPRDSVDDSLERTQSIRVPLPSTHGLETKDTSDSPKPEETNRRNKGLAFKLPSTRGRATQKTRDSPEPSSRQSKDIALQLPSTTDIDLDSSKSPGDAENLDAGVWGNTSSAQPDGLDMSLENKSALQPKEGSLTDDAGSSSRTEGLLQLSAADSLAESASHVHKVLSKHIAQHQKKAVHRRGVHLEARKTAQDTAQRGSASPRARKLHAKMHKERRRYDGKSAKYHETARRFHKLHHQARRKRYPEE